MCDLPVEPLPVKWEHQFRAFCRDADITGMANLMSQPDLFNVTMCDTTNGWTTDLLSVVCTGPDTTSVMFNTEDRCRRAAALQMLVPFVRAGLCAKLGEEAGQAQFRAMVQDALVEHARNPEDNFLITDTLMNAGGDPHTAIDIFSGKTAFQLAWANNLRRVVASMERWCHHQQQ